MHSSFQSVSSKNLKHNLKEILGNRVNRLLLGNPAFNSTRNLIAIATDDEEGEKNFLFVLDPKVFLEADPDVNPIKAYLEVSHGLVCVHWRPNSNTILGGSNRGTVIVFKVNEVTSALKKTGRSDPFGIKLSIFLKPCRMSHLKVK